MCSSTHFLSLGPVCRSVHSVSPCLPVPDCLSVRPLSVTVSTCDLPVCQSVHLVSPSIVSTCACLSIGLSTQCHSVYLCLPVSRSVHSVSQCLPVPACLSVCPLSVTVCSVYLYLPVYRSVHSVSQCLPVPACLSVCPFSVTSDLSTCACLSIGLSAQCHGVCLYLPVYRSVHSVSPLICLPVPACLSVCPLSVTVSLYLPVYRSVHSVSPLSIYLCLPVYRFDCLSIGLSTQCHL